MNTPTTPRIRIDDLPELQDLTPEEMEALLGAGRGKSVQLGIESLENRELMAASLTANLSSGLLRIEGTNAADRITVRQINNQISIDGIPILSANVQVPSVASAHVTRIEIDALDGVDWIDVQGLPPGSSPLAVWGRGGGDTFVGMPAGSVMDSGVGSDLQFLASVRTAADGDYLVDAGTSLWSQPVGSSAPHRQGGGIVALGLDTGGGAVLLDVNAGVWSFKGGVWKHLGSSGRITVADGIYVQDGTGRMWRQAGGGGSLECATGGQMQLAPGQAGSWQFSKSILLWRSGHGYTSVAGDPRYLAALVGSGYVGTWLTGNNPTLLGLPSGSDATLVPGQAGYYPFERGIVLYRSGMGMAALQGNAGALTALAGSNYVSTWLSGNNPTLLGLPTGSAEVTLMPGQSGYWQFKNGILLYRAGEGIFSLQGEVGTLLAVSAPKASVLTADQSHYIVDVDGGLWWLPAGTASVQRLGGGSAAIGLDASGAAVVLDINRVLWRYTQTTPQNLGGGDSALASANDGTYVMAGSGDLWWQPTGTGSVKRLGSGAAAIGVDPNGAAVVLDVNGVLWRYAQAIPQNLGGGASALAKANDGIYVVDSSGDLWWGHTSTSVKRLGSGAAAIGLDANNAAVVLDINRVLWRYTQGTPQNLGGGDSALAKANDGTYVVASSGDLWWQTASTSIRRLGSGSAAVGLDANGAAVVLDINRVLWRYTQGTPQNLGGGDSALARANDGIYVVESSGDLWWQTASTAIRRLGEGSAAIGLDASGGAVVLDINGVLWHYAQGTPQNLGGGASALAKANDGTYVMDSSGDLWWRHTSTSVTRLGGGSAAIGLDANGAAVVLDINGVLWSFAQGKPHNLGGGQHARAQARDGTYVVDSSGDLWWQYTSTSVRRLGGGSAAVGVDASGEAVVLDINKEVWLYYNGRATHLSSSLAAMDIVNGKLQVTYTAIGQKWSELGGASGMLGLPLGGESSYEDGGRIQYFQRGLIYSNPAKGIPPSAGGSSANSFAFREKLAEGWVEMRDFIYEEVLQPIFAPIVDSILRSKYFEDSYQPEWINPSNYAGRPVYYVNGAMTPYEVYDEATGDLIGGAKRQAMDLSEQLGRPVFLVHNATAGGDDAAQLASDFTWDVWRYQHNPTTREVAAIFYRAAERGEEVSIVAHSQGNLIVRNALRTMQFFKNEHWVQHNLKWVAIGSPLSPSDDNFPDEHHTNLINDHDPIRYIRDNDNFVEQFTSVLAALFHTIRDDATNAHSFWSYLGQIQNSNLWSIDTPIGNVIPPEPGVLAPLGQTESDAPAVIPVLSAEPELVPLPTPGTIGLNNTP